MRGCINLTNYLSVVLLVPVPGQGYTVSTLLSSEEALLNRAEAYVMKNQFDLALEDINLYLAERGACG